MSKKSNLQNKTNSTPRVNNISALNRIADNPIIKRNTNGEYAPIGYTKREVIPAEKAELVSMARAMNADFEPKLRNLFNEECQAATRAIETGLYVGYRRPENTWDCIRVTDSHKCFCGHFLYEHENFDGKKYMIGCKQDCKCKRFAFIPSRPEDVGEFWFARRKYFDVSAYRVKCKCKHAHDRHDPVLYNCIEKGCGCRAFHSDFLCSACDEHWERHETFFETENERKLNKLPYGENYRPFNEMKELKDILYDSDHKQIPIDNFQAPSNFLEYPVNRKGDDYILNNGTRKMYPKSSR